MSEFIACLEGITDHGSVEIALQSVNCFVLYPFHGPSHMPMVPTDQIVKLEESCHRDVKCIRLASARESSGLDVGPRQRLNLASYRQNIGHNRFQFLNDWPGVFRIGSQYFGHDHPGDHTSPANAVQHSQKSLHGSLTVTGLARRETSPNAGFKIKGWRWHAAILGELCCRRRRAGKGVILTRRPRLLGELAGCCHVKQGGESALKGIQ